jgi:sec-independent protein translocase protein TatA
MTFPVHAAFIDGIGGPELLLIFILSLMLFGGKRLPELARGVGRSVREFKRATAGVEQEIKRAIEDQPPTYRPPPAPAATVPVGRPATPPAELPPPATTTPPASSVGDEPPPAESR